VTGSSSAGDQGESYKAYLLTLLMVILTFNQIDGTALGILLQDIKTDLDLSDTQLGVLSGIAFAAFYSTMGVPIARWADRGNRSTVIAVTTAVWSVAVSLCGAAQSFLQLVAARMVVATGESGCIPSAHTLIADYFTRGERPRAVSRYMLGIPLALMVGYFTAGWLNVYFGWRLTFVILGLPGLPLAGLAALTIREPRRAARARAGALGAGAGDRHPEHRATLRDTFATLWHNPSFRHLLFCHSVWYFFGYGLLQWAPSFFVRSHGLATGEIGTWFALAYGAGGLIGVYFGGELATRYAAGNERLQLKACALAFVLFGGLNAFAYTTSNYRLAFAAMALAAIGGNIVQGPILATLQTLVPPRMRATSIALIYLFANLIGMGLGPLAAGALSDALQGRFGQDSLRYALLILCPGYLWAAWHLMHAARTITADLRGSAAEQSARPTATLPSSSDTRTKLPSRAP
jgi:MFS family permease